MTDSVSQTFEDALVSLEKTMEHYPASWQHAIPDAVLYNFAIDVREQVEAVRILVDTRAVRTALTNARSALESAVDAIYLTSSESDYDARGARARVFSLFQREHLRRRMGIEQSTMPGASPELEQVIIQDASDWDKHASDQGNLIRRAWKDFSSNGYSIGSHWSGESRTSLYRNVAVSELSSYDIISILDSAYGLLSAAVHPGHLEDRERIVTGFDQLTFQSRGSEGENAQNIAHLSMELVVQALRKRKTFS